MASLLTAVGLWMTAVTGLLPLRDVKAVVRHTLGSLLPGRGGQRRKGAAGVTPFQAVSTALAGTLGTGNIAGVAAAIVAGGPGAVFWMWCAALLGMATKYAEVLLAVEYRARGRDGSWQGGPMEYISRGLGMPWLAGVFCVFCLLASFGIGNAAQVGAVAQVLARDLPCRPWPSAWGWRCRRGWCCWGDCEELGPLPKNSSR